MALPAAVVAYLYAEGYGIAEQAASGWSVSYGPTLSEGGDYFITFKNIFTNTTNVIPFKQTVWIDVKGNLFNGGPKLEARGFDDYMNAVVSTWLNWFQQIIGTAWATWSQGAQNLIQNTSNSTNLGPLTDSFVALENRTNLVLTFSTWTTENGNWTSQSLNPHNRLIIRSKAHGQSEFKLYYDCNSTAGNNFVQIDLETSLRQYCFTLMGNIIQIDEIVYYNVITIKESIGFGFGFDMKWGGSFPWDSYSLPPHNQILLYCRENPVFKPEIKYVKSLQGGTLSEQQQHLKFGLVEKIGKQPPIIGDKYLTKKAYYEHYDIVNGEHLFRYVEIDNQDTGNNNVVVLPPNTTYRVTFYTGNKPSAGTDAKVSVKLIGTSGSSENIVLPAQNADMEKGSTNSYDLASKELGNLTALWIGHDNTGNGPGWFLSKVDVKNTTTGQVWFFPCDRWLATDEDDGSIQRTLHPSSSVA